MSGESLRGVITPASLGVMTPTYRTVLSEIECDPAPLPSVGPLIDSDASRAWVASNYSDESKRLVREGAEATAEDQAKWSHALTSGLLFR